MNTEINGVTIFTGSTFKEDFNIINTNCNKKISFLNTKFLKSFTLLNSVFGSDVDFENAIFRNSLRIQNVRFRGNVNMSSSEFYGETRIVFSILPDTLDLRGLKLDSLNGKLDFRYCILDTLEKKPKKCVVLVNGTDLSKLVLPAHLFTIEMSIYKLYNDRMKKDAMTNVYEQLIKQSRELGFMDSVEGWDIEYQRKINNINYGILGTLLNIVNQYWWNFGYNKSRILWLWLPLLYVIFSTINYFVLDWMVKRVYYDDEFGKNYKLTYAKVNTVYERIAYSLFYTAAIYFNFRLRHEAVNYKNLGGLIYLYLIYVTGTINVAFGVLSYIPQA